MTFQILTDSSLRPIVHTASMAPEKKMTLQDMKKIRFFLDGHHLEFITDNEFAETHLAPTDNKIGSFLGCNTLIVDDSNVESLNGVGADSAILFVDNESMLFNNFFTIVSNIHGIIDLRMKELNRYNNDILLPEIMKISKYIETAAKYTTVVVKQLSGFFLRDKFQDYGFNTFFVSPDLNIWCHPKFYYLQDNRGLLGSVVDLELNDELNHYTRPHLICESCNTFYCDRDVYQNLEESGDIKTPAVSTCTDTQVFAKLSKELYEKITGEHVPNDKLDRSETFIAEDEFEKQVTNSVIANNIKKINFIEEHIHKQQDKLFQIENSIMLLTRIIQEMRDDRSNN